MLSSVEEELLPRFLRGAVESVLHNLCHMAGWNHYAVKESTPQHLTRTKHSELGSVDPERMRWHNSSYRVGTTPLSLHMKHGQVILALRGPTVVKGHTVVHLAWATGRQYAWAEWWGYWT